MSLSSHQSARMKNDEWLTPPEIVKALGAFDLDPCSPVVRPWATAAAHFTKEDDGLSQPWVGRVWLNPPFGTEAVKWLRRMVKHGDGVALIPARTETAMFYECVWGRASAVCFMKGRPHFHYVDGRRAAANSGAPICLVAYGQRNVDALVSAGLGITMRLDSYSKVCEPDSKKPNGLQSEDCNPLISLENMAEWTGLEPATPGVTGPCANRATTGEKP